MITSMEETELYKENILDHYKHPRHKVKMSDATHSSTAHNPVCGDTIAIYIKISNAAIINISFTGEGCAISQASMSLLTDHLLGKQLEEVGTIGESDVYQLLGIPISHTRKKCALLSLTALHNALKNGTTINQPSNGIHHD